MIPVAEALERLFALVTPLPVEEVPLLAAHGRVLVRDMAARRTQPPFDGSAMDGYAVRSADAVSGATLRVTGTSAAGARFVGSVGPGETIRILTGAPMPEGADRVVIQEDVTRDGDTIRITGDPGPGTHVRAAGCDFATGWVLAAGRRLGPADLALLAAMNHATVPVTRRPEVAILATGDELVMPGEAPGPDQIVASNNFGLAALAERSGARVRMLPIARDTEAALAQGFRLADGADVIVTCGGASVGDHDLVAPVAVAEGAKLDFHKVAMRPGKPLMAGRIGDAILLGLPGNPVSAMVCGTIFLAPLLAALSGLPAAPAPRRSATLGADLPANGPREHYVRATMEGDTASALPEQDSSLLRVLAMADALIVRPPGDGARAAGEQIQIIPL